MSEKKTRVIDISQTSASSATQAPVLPSGGGSRGAQPTRPLTLAEWLGGAMDLTMLILQWLDVRAANALARTNKEAWNARLLGPPSAKFRQRFPHLDTITEANVLTDLSKQISQLGQRIGSIGSSRPQEFTEWPGSVQRRLEWPRRHQHRIPVLFNRGPDWNYPLQINTPMEQALAEASRHYENVRLMAGKFVTQYGPSRFHTREGWNHDDLKLLLASGAKLQRLELGPLFDDPNGSRKSNIRTVFRQVIATWKSSLRWLSLRHNDPTVLGWQTIGILARHASQLVHLHYVDLGQAPKKLHFVALVWLCKFLRQTPALTEFVFDLTPDDEEEINLNFEPRIDEEVDPEDNPIHIDLALDAELAKAEKRGQPLAKALKIPSFDNHLDDPWWNMVWRMDPTIAASWVEHVEKHRKEEEVFWIEWVVLEEKLSDALIRRHITAEMLIQNDDTKEEFIEKHNLQEYEEELEDMWDMSGRFSEWRDATPTRRRILVWMGRMQSFLVSELEHHRPHWKRLDLPRFSNRDELDEMDELLDSSYELGKLMRAHALSLEEVALVVHHDIDRLEASLAISSDGKEAKEEKEEKENKRETEDQDIVMKQQPQSSETVGSSDVAVISMPHMRKLTLYSPQSRIDRPLRGLLRAVPKLEYLFVSSLIEAALDSLPSLPPLLQELHCRFLSLPTGKDNKPNLNSLLLAILNCQDLRRIHLPQIRGDYPTSVSSSTVISGQHLLRIVHSLVSPNRATHPTHLLLDRGLPFSVTASSDILKVAEWTNSMAMESQSLLDTLLQISNDDELLHFAVPTTASVSDILDKIVQRGIHLQVSGAPSESKQISVFHQREFFDNKATVAEMTSMPGYVGHAAHAGHPVGDMGVVVRIRRVTGRTLVFLRFEALDRTRALSELLENDSNGLQELHFPVGFDLSKVESKHWLPSPTHVYEHGFLPRPIKPEKISTVASGTASGTERKVSMDEVLKLQTQINQHRPWWPKLRVLSFRLLPLPVVHESSVSRDVVAAILKFPPLETLERFLIMACPRIHPVQIRFVYGPNDMHVNWPHIALVLTRLQMRLHSGFFKNIQLVIAQGERLRSPLAILERSISYGQTGVEPGWNLFLEKMKIQGIEEADLESEDFWSGLMDIVRNQLSGSLKSDAFEVTGTR